MSNFHSLKNKLDQGKSVFGIWNIICCPMLIEIGASAGLDFQIFDFEHGTFDVSKLHTCIIAAERHLCSPLVRIPKNDANLVQRCLDLGIQGIIFPQIRNHNEALTCLSYTQFPPKGDKGYNPFTRSSLIINNQIDTQPITGIIVENKQSYNQLEEIVKLPLLDIIYIGVYDLSVDLGCPGELSNHKLQAMINTIIQTSLKAEKHVGMMVHNQEDITHYHNMGVRFFVFRVDTKIYFDSIFHSLEKFKGILI